MNVPTKLIALLATLSLLLTGCPDDPSGDTGDTAGADVTGTDAAGTDTAGTDAAGTDTAGTDTAGTDAAGTDTAGTDTTGTDTAGTDTTDTTGPITNACTNSADLAVVTTVDVQTEVTTCAITCSVTDPTNLSECTRDCLAAAISISSDCASCFSDISTCVLATCATECSNPASQACSNCSDGSGCDANLPTCSGLTPPAGPDPAATAQIVSLLTGTAGDVSGAAVSYIKPSFDAADPGGFFVQAEAGGAAIFIIADPAAPCAGCDPVDRGDIVDFTVDTVDAARNEPTAVTALSNLSVSSSGYDVRQLTNDINSATDVVTGLDSYESTLISVDITMATDVITGAGPGYDRFEVNTAGITGDAALQLRLPEVAQRNIGLETGCVITVHDTPMWRFQTNAQISFWNPQDVTLTSCPSATDLVTAQALSDTEVLLTFSRGLNDTTVTADGSDFTIADAGGTALTVSAASIDTNGARFEVRLTTAVQTGATVYTVTVGSSVQDVFGQALGVSTADFNGFQLPAVLRINEINANIGGGCDLVELRVIEGGTVEGFTFAARDGADAAEVLPAITVAKNDYIVMHWNSGSGGCNASTSTSETASKNEQPESAHAQNYDAAWDVYVTDAGLTNTDNVFEIRDFAGNIQDALFAAQGATGTTAGATENAAAPVAAAGEWTNTDGSVPAGGYIDDVFNANAALGLKASNSVTGDTIQRMNDDDNNHMGDWTIAAPSWGVNNAGQTDL